MKISVKQIEEAALNAWPAIHQIFYDGWVLRFSMGYTKRANSINPLYSSVLDLEEKVDDCEKVYARAGLPPIFRLTPLASEDLDAILEKRGYRSLDFTHVMVLDLANRDFQEPQETELRELPLEQWMGVFSSINGSVLARQPGHAEILQGILNPHLMAALEKSGQWLTCGLGVLERELFGLFDIVTRADYRQQGLATDLIEGMLGWAKSKGASNAYLQVMDANTSARRLYERLGYVDLYSYWYRLPGDT